MIETVPISDMVNARWQLNIYAQTQKKWDRRKKWKERKMSISFVMYSKKLICKMERDPKLFTEISFLFFFLVIIWNIVNVVIQRGRAK